jgi:hypothetical protein
MSGAIPPLPQHAYMVWCSVKAQCSICDVLAINRFASTVRDVQGQCGMQNSIEHRWKHTRVYPKVSGLAAWS